MTFTLQSPAFADGEPIPDKYARDGQNVSPPLAWRDAPEDVQSYAVIVEDPDAPSGTFRHWAMYNIEPQAQALGEGAGKVGNTEGAALAINDFGQPGYDGPQPPKGHGVHHYHFRLAALDVGALDLPLNAKVEQVWAAVQPHILAQAEMVGTYENP